MGPLSFDKLARPRLLLNEELLWPVVVVAVLVVAGGGGSIATGLFHVRFTRCPTTHVLLLQMGQ